MAKPCTPHLISQAAQLFELLVCNGGVKGQSPLRSLGGSKGAILSRERMAPFARTPAGTQGKGCSARGAAIIPPRLRGPPQVCYTFIKSIKKESLL